MRQPAGAVVQWGQGISSCTATGKYKAVNAPSDMAERMARSSARSCRMVLPLHRAIRLERGPVGPFVSIPPGRRAIDRVLRCRAGWFNPAVGWRGVVCSMVRTFTTDGSQASANEQLVVRGCRWWNARLPDHASDGGAAVGGGHQRLLEAIGVGAFCGAGGLPLAGAGHRGVGSRERGGRIEHRSPWGRNAVNFIPWNSFTPS